ncbi:DUF2339 domain-containing protein [Sphingomonas sp.]|uniref:DUF2339 domain-containing protein n=1 Tax=Sphingomonas sp. TaxID=28214 RepID=UPI002DD6738C|nr:DUF2339 domain-containing protein [Sphingomonas sp.]
MEFAALLWIATLVAFVVGYRRIARLETEVAALRGPPQVDPLPETAPPQPVEPAPRAAAAVVRAPARIARTAPPPVEAEEPTSPEPAPPPRNLESLIGGQLPIWVGGAALVIAAFFLVRYSIESGLLGPGVRVALAALFSVALIAASEIARRLPATRDDPRVGQVLAGAGTASAYGTLYVAAAQYHLVGPFAGFVLMIVITAGALFLALRHGPPTAIMALIGGFAAPMVAGFDAAGIGPLLAYLALFIAALFALAAHRGWVWLALAAVVAGFGWANLLILLLDGRDTAAVGAFVVALAIGATLALPRTGVGAGWLRAAPMIAGLVQLLVIAPTLDFGAIAWIFHLVLAATALVLGWRDRALLPAALAAACLVTVLVAAGLVAPERSATPVAAAIASLLFAGNGIAFSRRATLWPFIALVGLAGPLLAAHLFADDLLPAALWTMFELAAAAAALLLAWRHRDVADARDPALVGGSAAATLLAATGLATLAGWSWAPVALVPVLVAMAFWGRLIADRDVLRLPALILIAIALLAAEVFAAWISAGLGSLAGTRLIWPLLPPLADMVRMVAAPVLAAAALLALPGAYGGARRPVTIALAIAGVLVAYTLAKQVLRIAADPAFVSLGLAERAAITVAFAGAGWGLIRHGRFLRTGQALLALAAIRFVWLDLLILNPVVIPQAVGSIPILNLAVLLPALLALAVWYGLPERRWRRFAFLLVVVAVAGGVRQFAQGTMLTGNLESGETWGYSAAFLLLATVWLWRGLVGGHRDLRVAALALLTLVTVKVFLVDVAALGGVLRILSFLGLGIALIGIGWAYNRLIARPPAPVQPSP